MRILYCNSLKSDYVQDQLFAGLTELLGSESVRSFPVNSLYYLPLKRYPRNMGLSRSFPSLLGDKFRARKGIAEFAPDLVVIASTKRDTLEAFLSIEPQLPKGVPLVYIDGGDWPEVGGDANRMNFESLYQDVFQHRRPDLIFKRECLVDKEYPDNVIPLPMAFRPQPGFSPLDKRYQVTLWCVESDPIRTQALELLQGRYDCIENGSVHAQQFHSYSRKGLNYLRELSASKIACNFRGVGWDTMRYWEIPGVSAFMVSQRPGIVIPNNFIDGKHVAFCQDDLSDFTDKLDYYLKNENERETMATAAYKHLMDHHTHLHRAKYFLDNVRQRLVISR
ncbi:MAG: glycosyltransferase [Pseudomonadota bacterium]